MGKKTQSECSACGTVTRARLGSEEPLKESKPDHRFILKRIEGRKCRLDSGHTYPINLYTEEEAHAKAQKRSGEGSGERFGVFELVGIYEPISNTKYTPIDEL